MTTSQQPHLSQAVALQAQVGQWEVSQQAGQRLRETIELAVNQLQLGQERQAAQGGREPVVQGEGSRL